MVLVGVPQVIEAQLARHGTRLPIVDAPEVIGMGKTPPAPP